MPSTSRSATSSPLRSNFLGAQQVKNLTDPVASYRVLVDRPGSPAAGPAKRPADPAAPRARAAANGPPAPDTTVWTSLHDRLGSLPGPLRIALTFVAFLFVLNLFSGFDDIWFHWPAAPILFVTSYYLLTRRRRDPK